MVAARDRKDIGLSKISQTQESTCCVIPLHGVLDQGKLIYVDRNEDSGGLCVGREWGGGTSQRVQGTFRGEGNAAYLVLSVYTATHICPKPLN